MGHDDQTAQRSRGVIITRRRLSWGLLAIAAGLLLYTGSQYGRMYFRQKQMGVEWRQQQEAAPTLGGQSGNASGHPSLTRLQIPKIALDAVVGEGDSRRQLLEGPGHLEQSAQPGEPGNSVITAHRDTFFRHIVELEAEDEIVIQRNGRTFRYQVTGKKVVKPEDLSVIAPSRDAELTLITCYPIQYIGAAPERLVVVARLAN